MVTRIYIFLIFLFVLLPCFAEETLNTRKPSSNNTSMTHADTEKLYKIREEYLPKVKIARSFDMRNLDWGEMEKYDEEDLVHTPPLKLKNRIYARYHKEEGQFVPDLTLPNGYFAVPDTYIVPGSIVPGIWMGVKGVNYLFEKNKKGIAAWTVTTKAVSVFCSELVGRELDGKPKREIRLCNPPPGTY